MIEYVTTKTFQNSNNNFIKYFNNPMRNSLFLESITISQFGIPYEIFKLKLQKVAEHDNINA